MVFPEFKIAFVSNEISGHEMMVILKENFADFETSKEDYFEVD